MCSVIGSACALSVKGGERKVRVRAPAHTYNTYLITWITEETLGRPRGTHLQHILDSTLTTWITVVMGCHQQTFYTQGKFKIVATTSPNKRFIHKGNLRLSPPPHSTHSLHTWGMTLSDDLDNRSNAVFDWNMSTGCCTHILDDTLATWITTW